MRINIKGNIRDILKFTKLIPERIERIQNASSDKITSDPINELAFKLHPDTQHLMISDIFNETKSTKTFKLVPDLDSNTRHVAYFRAGQYLSLKVDVIKGKDTYRITRPYSISSSPFEALKGFYEITIKKTEGGFLSEFAWQNWKVGTKIEASDPQGFFYYDPIRDKPSIIGLGGGSGITPFRSMAREITSGKMNANLTLFYGSSDEEDIIFFEEFSALAKNYPEKLKIINVLSCEIVTLAGCLEGFITADIIQTYADVNESSIFICGPQAMYNFLKTEIDSLNLPTKRIRQEMFGEIKNITQCEGFPLDKAENIYTIKVKMGKQYLEVPANATETVLVALERAKLAPPSRCRSGECGWCRSRLISGDIFISPESDGRRIADKKFGYFHPCSSYPISNLEIEVPTEF
ncbi:MAG: 2Fe-2S iron-sulfur cluster binding domain-containing protein [Candidatus Lokiarchaeota archaeon]|nr:2Fe-2S iron-sulfur cluster binding domain-containing protein [Candidatus Lokiarchaeota archaeon]